MNGKRILSLAFITFIASLWCVAKVYNGMIVDRENNPIDFVTITMWVDSTLCGGTTTDQSGYFKIETENNINLIKINYVGFDSKIITISPTVTDLGTIILERNVTQLSEVTVKAPVVVRETDRFIMNIAADPGAKGKNMQQVLNTAPGVWLDRNKCTLFGSQGTVVYVDDRRLKLTGERLYEYLCSLQSSSVASVEIIPHAGSEYSATYTGGVISIKLKKKRDNGVSGYAALSTTGGHNTFSMLPNFNLGYHKDKLTLNFIGSVSVNPYNRAHGTDYTTNENNGTIVNSENTSRSHQIIPNILGTVVYDIDKKSQFGFEAEYNPSFSHSITTSISELNTQFQNTRGKYNYHRQNHSFDTRANYYRYVNDNGAYIKFIAGYSYREGRSDEYNLFKSEVQDSTYTVDNTSRYHTVNGEVRFFYKFTSKVRLQAGVKHTYNNILNQSFNNYLQDNIWMSSPGYDLDVLYRENITALYANVYMAYGRLSVMPGARYEYYVRNSDYGDNTQSGIYPTLSASYNLTKRGEYSLGFNFSSKVRRPTFTQQNPIVRQHSDYTYSVGNPNLKSQRAYKFELSGTMVSRTHVGIEYDMYYNSIQQTVKSNPLYPERAYYTYINNGRENNITCYVTGNYPIGKYFMAGGTAIYQAKFIKKTSHGNKSGFNGQFSFLSK